MSTDIKFPRQAGIYKITCIVNNKIYIGKSVNLYNRLNKHKNCQNKIKGTWYFENAIIKYKWKSFTVEILELFENFDKTDDSHKKSLLERETYYIKWFDSANKDIGYNIQKHSNDSTGNSKRPISNEHRQKLRIARAKQIRGPMSDETKEKLRYIRTEEEKERLRMLRVGSSITEDHKNKIRESNIGRKHTEETKKKIGDSKIGRSHSEEAKKKMRAAKLGKKLSDEHIQKIKLSKLNKK